MRHKNVVIGTGLSALAVVKALIKRGEVVTVLDSGIKINKKTAGLIDYEKIHLAGKKSYYGDLTVTDTKIETLQANGIPTNSLVYGGLSNIWGGSLAFDKAVFNSVQGEYFDNLDSCYREVMEWLPVKESEFVFDNDEVNCKEFKVKPAIHAIKAKNCIGEKICLYGCPNNAILNAGDEFDRLQACGQIKIISGYIVEKVYESNSAVEIKSADKMIEADNCFVCAGPTNTAQIVLNSVDDIKYALIKDSQYLITPVLWPKDIAAKIKLFPSRSFANLETNLNGEKIHSQFYGMSKYLDNQIKYSHKRVHSIISLLKNQYERLGIVQSYLPSSVSGSALMKREGGGMTMMQYGSYSKEHLDMVLQKIKIALAEFGGHTFGAATIIPPLMAGYHFGASFPMSHVEQRGTSDYLGRIKPFRNIYICDASVLPAIPSTSPTLLSLVNGTRIVDKVFS